VRKRLLMIAFHYPPCHGSSGMQRTLAFTRYLGQHGWQPAVLTVTPNAYESTSRSLLANIPSEVFVKRVLTLDAARDLSVFGRYPSRLAVPDRWVSWRINAVRAGLRMIRDFEPDAIWSTYPIATAHMIAASIAAKSGLPWVADMRDPMVEFDPHTGIEFPEDPAIRAARLRIESDVARLAQRVVFCTEGARKICVERYGDGLSHKFEIIPNGYDEQSFQEAEAALIEEPRAGSTAFVLLHSGTVYPGSDRGPEGLFQALKSLARQHALPDGFKLVFRAPGHEEYLRELVSRFDLAAIVELRPQISYRAALLEMLQSDALLVIQGPSSNPAIPAKLYEYFRTRKPLFGLVHPEGDTAALMRSMDAGLTAPPDTSAHIASALQEFFSGIEAGKRLTVSERNLAKFSRSSQTVELAALLDSL